MTRWAAGLALAGILTACGAPHVNSPSHPSGPHPLSAVLFPEGTAIDVETLAARLEEVDVVYVGERHDSDADHDVAAALVQLLRPDLVGMEMFQRPYQAPLDAFGRGEIDEAAMLVATEWETRWGRPFSGYRPILDAARAVNARVLALNAPREWTRTIGRGGVEALAPEVQSALPELVLDEPAHRAMVTEALSGHGGHGGAMDPAMLERFYVAQVVWDETMGETLATALAAEPGHRAVVIAGRMHVQRGLGIPRTAARRGVRSHRVVLPLTAEEIAAERETPTGLCDIALLVE